MFNRDDDLFVDDDDGGLDALRQPKRNQKQNQPYQQNNDIKVEDDDDYTYSFPKSQPQSQKRAQKEDEPQQLSDLLNNGDDSNSYYTSNRINQRINNKAGPRVPVSRHQEQNVDKVLYSPNGGTDDNSSNLQASTQFSDFNASGTESLLGKATAPPGRPGTSGNARLRLMEQKKANLLKQNSEAGSVVTNLMLRGPKAGNNIYQGSTYEFQNNPKDSVYDPSFKGMDSSGFNMQLSKNKVVISTKDEEPEQVAYSSNSRQPNYATPQPVNAAPQEYSSPPQSQQQDNYYQQQQDNAKSDSSESPREQYKQMGTSKASNNDEDRKEMGTSDVKDDKGDSSDEEQTKYDAADIQKRKELDKVPDAPIVALNQEQDPQYQSKILNIDIRDIVDMRAFLMSPVPKGYRIECTIKRDRSGFARINPKYHCFLSNGRQDLMSAKKRAYNKTSNYLISYNKTEIKKSSSFCLGKLRSNFLGTEFNVFDHGLNPNKSSDIEKLRANLGVVLYESNLLSAKGPRKMRVLIPDVNENTSEIYQFKPLSEREGILSNFKAGKKTGIKELMNKNPKWNEQLQAFVLNFNGRVEKPSVKNFQCIDEQSDERIYLQFGRVTNDQFNMDIEWPLSPFQAFAICLSSFDYKIACE